MKLDQVWQLLSTGLGFSKNSITDFLDIEGLSCYSIFKLASIMSRECNIKKRYKILTRSNTCWTSNCHGCLINVAISLILIQIPRPFCHDTHTSLLRTIDKSVSTLRMESCNVHIVISTRQRANVLHPLLDIVK